MQGTHDPFDTLHKYACSSFPKIDSLELEAWSLDNMSRSQCIRVQIVLTVRVEEPFLMAVQYSRQTGRVSQSEDAPVWVLSRCTDNGDRFWEHHLVAGACVQISR
jgi:hypothetical protein